MFFTFMHDKIYKFLSLPSHFLATYILCVCALLPSICAHINHSEELELNI